MKRGFSRMLSPYVDIFLTKTEEIGGGDLGKLFVLGGRRPGAEWLRAFALSNALDVWAIDSGVASCRAAGLGPSVIVGDRDSATRGDWSWAVDEGASEYLHDPAKDLTDFQLALELLERDKTTELPTLTGCFGGRTDHFLSVLETYIGSGVSADRGRPRCMIDDAEGMFLIYSRESAVFSFRKRPVAVSLLSMSERCGGVFISGVRWPLDNVVLERKFPWAISNEVGERDVLETEEKEQKVPVSCGEGTLAVCWSYCR